MKSRQMKSPIGYFGGKYYLAEWLMRFIPEHKCFVEVFGGSGALLFAKTPSYTEVYNDIDGDLYTFFDVLKDPVMFGEFCRLSALTPYSRQLWREMRDSKIPSEPVKRAYRFFVLIRQSFSGGMGSWSKGIVKNNAVKFLKIVDRLPEVHRRLQRIAIENLDWADCIKAYDRADTVLYLDPPYVQSTRKAIRYNYDMTDADHERLVDVLLGVKANVMLSGYANSIYKILEDNGWGYHDTSTFAFSAPKTEQVGNRGVGGLQGFERTERLWLNYELPENRQIEIFS